MSLSTYPEIKFSRVKHTAPPSTIKTSRETTLRLITVQYRKKPPLTPDLDGQRAKLQQNSKEKNQYKTIIMIVDGVQTLGSSGGSKPFNIPNQSSTKLAQRE